jgi:hypothetical protein
VQEREPGRPGRALYSLELPQFFQFQSAYRKKVLSVLRHVWHRGCVLIVKQYRWLRPQGRAVGAGERSQAGGKWTFKGYKPAGSEQSERRWVDDEVLSKVHQFTYSDGMSRLQQYYFRAASVHQNVDLNYFLNEEGMESTDIPSPESLWPQVTLSDLPDIRDTPAYHAYIKTTGGSLDLRTNGYKELSKESRAELRFAATNLMRQ